MNHSKAEGKSQYTEMYVNILRDILSIKVSFCNGFREVCISE